MVSNDKSARAQSSAIHTLLLHPDDTVLVCIRTIEPGDALIIDQSVVHAATPVQVGHKVARQAFKPGDKVFKYGVPIGSITKAVSAGDHVDRKSTRLNSSHVAISYAVFCLKK